MRSTTLTRGFVLATLLSITFSAAAQRRTPLPTPVPPPPPPPAPAVVSTEWLAGQLGNANLRVLDARGFRTFLLSHIPGSQGLEPANLRSTSGGVPALIYDRTVLHAIANRVGLDPDKEIVVYGDESDIDATFVAVILRLSGLHKVAILDGGFKKWTAEKRPVDAERRLVPKSWGPLAADSGSLVSLDEMKRVVAEKKVVLLDVRSAEQFKAGHIPSAKNRFWKNDVVPEGKPNAGTLRPEAEVKAELEAMGITPDKRVIVYCNSGHQSSEGFFTLKYRLGFPNVFLYDGSWLEWSMIPETPKETDAPPAVK